MASIYCERQRGDLCRLHSINAYFGYKKLCKIEFLKYCKEYDNLISGLKTTEMDGFSEGRCIISYILDKLDNKYLFLIPIKSYNGIRNHIDIERYCKIMNNINGLFEFNKGHVWLNKKIDGYWYKIDSISGVNKIDKPSIKNNGYLLIVDGKLLYYEINYIMHCMIKYSEEFELYGVNLYYMLKVINLTHYSKNKDYNIHLDVLNTIKDNLSIYIKQNRLNNETENLKNMILKDILYISKL